MGLVRIVVNAHWNTGSSAQRVLFDWVYNGDSSGHRVRIGVCSGSLLALQTVLSEQDVLHLIDYARW
jgi:hypothetical protein